MIKMGMGKKNMADIIGIQSPHRKILLDNIPIPFVQTGIKEEEFLPGRKR